MVAIVRRVQLPGLVEKIDSGPASTASAISVIYPMSWIAIVHGAPLHAIFVSIGARIAAPARREVLFKIQSLGSSVWVPPRHQPSLAKRSEGRPL